MMRRRASTRLAQELLITGTLSIVTALTLTPRPSVSRCREKKRASRHTAKRRPAICEAMGAGILYRRPLDFDANIPCGRNSTWYQRYQPTLTPLGLLSTRPGKFSCPYPRQRCWHVSLVDQQRRTGFIQRGLEAVSRLSLRDRLTGA